MRLRMKMPPKNLTYGRQSFVFQGYLQENSIAVLPSISSDPTVFSVIISCLNSDSPTILFLLLLHLLTCQICLPVRSCGISLCKRIWRIVQGPRRRALLLGCVISSCCVANSRNPRKILFRGLRTGRCSSLNVIFHVKFIFHILKWPTHLFLTVDHTPTPHLPFQEMIANRLVTFPLWINYISDSNGGFFG